MTTTIDSARFLDRAGGVSRIAFWASLLLLAVLPFFVGSYWLGVLTIGLFFATFSVSWDMVFGHSGQVHFGPSFLVALGGYTSGLLSNHTELGVWACIGLGTGAATVGGVLLALPALRLTGPFLGLVTLAATLLLLNLVIVYSRHTGGERGNIVRDYVSLSERTNYYIVFALLLACLVCSAYVLRSRVGLILAAIGQSVRDVEVVGISATRYKVGVFAVSAAFSGLGGALLVHYIGSMSPALLLALPVAITILMGAILGGSGTLFGPALGAILLTVINEVARPLGDYRLLIVTAFVWFVIVVAVDGIVGVAKAIVSRLLPREEESA